ncbi:IclR family transcriptional regulator domain-containing protein [Paraburkholderia heleia]|uniref:IclR family transcriptional regulator domain-containing protein n=1 Tax=Paraburkholderia heleia TaxID=634127 RepID=UPI0031D13F98
MSDIQDSSDQSEPRYFVKALDRSLQVICAFSAESSEMTLSQVAARTGLTRASARRILLSLVDLGYAEKEGNLFRLRPRVLQIGYAYLSSLGVAHRGQYVLERLMEDTGESCSICVLDGTDIVYVARAIMPGLASIAIAIGARLPAHATAMGRVLLAGLPPDELDEYFQNAELKSFTSKTITSEAALRKVLKKTREQGYAYISGELDDTMESIAVPVTKAGGRVIAAMSLYTGRITEEVMLGDFLTKMRNAAKVLSEG